MKAAVCYEIVNASGEHPKYYFKNPPNIVERLYIKWKQCTCRGRPSILLEI